MNAIVQYLKDAVFDPQDIAAMSTALEEVCQTLQIDGDATAREVIAIRIIELSRRGERNPAKLRDRLLAEANGGTGYVEERMMPIRPYLGDQAFEPELIRAMSWAMEEVCNRLHVCDDPSRGIIAVRIIELAQCSVHSGIALRDRVLREANVPLLVEDTPLAPWHQQGRF